MTTPDQPTGMNELREALNKLVDDVHLANYARDKGETPQYSTVDAEAAIQEIVERCIGQDEKSKHVRRFQCPNYGNGCYEWAEQWKMNSEPPYCSTDGRKMKSVEFDEEEGDDWTRNELRAEIRHNLQQAGLLRGDELTQKPAEETEGQ